MVDAFAKPLPGKLSLGKAISIVHDRGKGQAENVGNNIDAHSGQAYVTGLI